MTRPGRANAREDLGVIRSALRRPLGVIWLFSGVTNVLALTGSLFMLTVYDRVIPSGSVPTLIVLGLLALFFFGVQALFDILRGRMLVRVGLVVKDAIAPRVYDIAVRRAAARDMRPDTTYRDLDQVHSFLTSQGPVAIFDLPWLPLFLAVLFAFHPYLGFTVLCGAIVLVGLTLLSNAATAGPTRELSEATGEQERFLERSRSSAETIRVLGMTHAMASRWDSIGSDITLLTRRAADIARGLGTLSRSFRMILQSTVLAIGALLVIRQEATGGIIIASSILTARALSPVEQATSNWRNIVAARQAWRRLKEILAEFPEERSTTAPPAPHESVSCENVSVMLPGTNRILVRNVSFRLRSGQALGIIGPTGSGKSTLMRAVVGLTAPELGNVRMDDQDVRRWSAAERGRYIGYLPQSVMLFEGTLAQNISRFDPEADPRAVVDAARKAGVHGMISRLEAGYDTVIDGFGGGLSGGQMQRIGLARALYGDPFLLALDEPNSNLDEAGEAALREAMGRVVTRGGIVIVVAHRPSVLNDVDHMLVMSNGKVQAYGPREDVMQNVDARRRKPVRVAKQDVIEPAKPAEDA